MVGHASEKKTPSVVISGIAGRFPKSDNVAELQFNLLNKIDCTTSEHGRWEYDDVTKIPQCIGKCNNLEKFDRVFFGVHTKLTVLMDPLSRLLLEHTFEAIVDAGINPKTLRGRNIAVYTATNISESEKTIFNPKVQKEGFGIMGGSKAMVPNRLSFFLGVTGSSINIDSGCTGSASALERAYYDLKNGLCEGAIVAGCILSLHPHLSYQLKKLGLLSTDGKTRSFDDLADGHTRSESIAVLFLQRAEDAKRIYQEVVNIKQGYSVGEDVNSIFYPTIESQIKVMKEILNDSGLTPDDISFMEASGMGIKKRDAEELQAIDAVYGKRKKPLHVGSIKSNIGDAIPVNTINSIIKMIVASETGQIPPNLHYEIANSEALCLKEGRLRISTELVPWTGPYSSVNTTAVGGVVSNIILKAPSIEKKNNGLPDDNLQRLVIVSGRTEKAVKKILNYMEQRPLDVEFLQMIYDVFQSGIDSYLYRGYTVISTETSKTITHPSEVLFNTGEKKEIWWVFSGMGSQWAGMGEALLKLPVFKAAIKKCDNVLKPLGYDIYKVITDKDPHTFDQIINSFIGIAAIQIGLVDVLKAVGLEPDYIIGHSVGELGCAYADGCFTAEQMIIAALSRGLASTETELVRGSMAAVGLGYEDIKPLCPPDIDVACHNGPESSTISGPAESMKEFVASLTAKGIFAREVPCSNIAYHSRYIAHAGSKLLERLKKVIPEPKPRSTKWVSTSVPRAEWNTLKARLCSAEYHTNNLLNPVLFEETSRLIPANAVCVEIAPHGLLQAILKRSLPKTCVNIPLTRRGHPDNLDVLLIALGKLYTVGLHPQVSNLYPKVEYPVGRGTPSLSSLIKWDHNQDWNVNYYRPAEMCKEGSQTVEINLNEEAFAFLRGNNVNGKTAIPLSFCLVQIWEIFKSFYKVPVLNVVFENIQVRRLFLNVPYDAKVSLTFMVLKGTGKFEVNESNSAVLSGVIKTSETPDRERLNLLKLDSKAEKQYELDVNDFYTEMKMRGFEYNTHFRTVSKISIDGKEGVLKWNGDWAAYIDGALQLYSFAHDTRQVLMPLSILKIVIDSNLHDSASELTDGTRVFVNKKMNYLSTSGLGIQGLKLSVVPKILEQNKSSVDTFVTVSNIKESVISITTGLRLILQLVFENTFLTKRPVIEIVKHHNLKYIQSDTMTHIPEASLFKIENDISYDNAKFNTTLTILDDVITNEDITNISQKLANGKFVLTFISSDRKKAMVRLIESNGLKIIFLRRLETEYIVLLKKKQIISKLHTVEINENVMNLIKKIDNIKISLEHERIVIIVKSGSDIRLSDLEDRLENGLDLRKIRMFDLGNLNIPNHSLVKLLEKQLEFDILVNILTLENTWATLRKMAVELKPKLFKSWRANQKYLHDPFTFTWTEAPSNSKNNVQVEYSSLNPQDLLLANGTLYGNSSKLEGKNRINPISIGLEFAGIDLNGNRVMGITQGNAMSNYVSADQDWIWNVPASWSLEDAATVPLSYVIAYSACYIKAKIKPGEKVVIVNPCAEFGLATLNLALHMKCDVFITYQNEEEKTFLQSVIPNIQNEKLVKLADGSFQDRVLVAAKGRGVDVVICNKCRVKDVDLFFSIVKRESRVIFISDLSNDAIHESIGMSNFLREIGLFTIVPAKILLCDSKTKKVIANMLNDGIRAGHVKPLKKMVYDRNSLSKALIACKENKHMEKIVVKTQPEGSNADGGLAVPRCYCSEKHSYIILEGLTLFGLELIDWLITRGAKKFIVTSTCKVKNGYAKLRMKYWKDYGIHLVLHEEFNYSNEKNIKALFKEAQSLGSLNGLFDVRLMGISNATLSNANVADSFGASIAVVDQESRRYRDNLRLFVIFSKNEPEQQSNIKHSSNKEVETLLNKRKEDGLPGLLIKWKFIHTEIMKYNTHTNYIMSPTVSNCLQKLDTILSTESSLVEFSYLIPTNNECENKSMEKDNFTADSNEEGFESFTASLYENYGVFVDFEHLTLDV